MRKIFIEWILQEKVFLVREGIWKMPADMVSFAVSTGLGVSVVAGIISGVCYVLAYGSQRKSSRKSKSNLHCDVCGEYFRSIDHILGGDCHVTCSKCQKNICQKRCANFDEQQNIWTCKNCLRPPESWFQGILYAIQPNKKDFSMDSNVMESSQVKNVDHIQKSKEQVQDFIEKLVNSMLGQNIDDANITKMYNDENYLPLTGQQSPCTAHAALKQLIEKLLHEVANLPQLQRPQQGTAIPPDLNNRTYEDLLATAILNKVISNSQNARPSSSAASVSSRISNSSHIKDDKGFFFGEETLDSKWRHPDIETTSVSSLEDWLQTDSSFGSRKYVDRVTLTIKQDIEEVSHASDSDHEGNEDDDNEYFRTKSSFWSDDEPNWFLQKRTFQGTHSPVPVPMLVPNPTIEAKVLIGDKEVDDTSDLSDVESEYGDTEIVPARHSILVNSKTLIGGKNPLQNGVGDVESESESSADSGVKEVDRGQSVFDESEFTDRAEGGSQNEDEHHTSFVSKADITIDDDNVEDASLMSVYSNTEQEAEYTERYASLPRKIEKRPDPHPRSSEKIKTDYTNYETPHKVEDYDKEAEEVRRVQKHFSGSYSTREKEKWKNAVEMKNNPYSKENIEKRIKRSNSGVDSIFGPDYYAKMASSPSGTKGKVKELVWPPIGSEESDDIVDFIEKEEIQQVPPKHISTTYIAAEETKDNFKAVPVIVEPVEASLSLETSLPPKSPLNGSEMTSLTSDSDLSYVHVYDVENAVISKKTRDQPIKSEPEKNNRFVKGTTTTTRRFTNNQPLKRYKSETDLLDDSFYSPPKVLGRKKDNTLISKIYLDPHVRSFVLSNREHLPENNKVPTFRTQLSSPEMVLDHKAYHSDDGLSLRHTKRYFSSQEDLLSSNSIEVHNGTMTHTAKMSFSSEDEQFSEKSPVFSTAPVNRRIYSSSEDLLSADEIDSSKKKDNTLISKIYQQPHVRQYALTARPFIPVKEEKRIEKSISSEDEVFIEITKAPKVSSPKVLPDLDTQFETMNIKEKEPATNEHDNENDPGVEEIARKKIVHNFLQKYSTSSTNLKITDSREDITNEEDITISVKDLRKRFEKNQPKNNIVSSLTARSLSKQMKEELRN
ncbi:uncharacterized protein [Diabrotica undecimpunctata]|uniref:uncharacterized protein isoform X1 n=1 Tax=Diabrotica undecimpunctata TaxID=50387 RepID=UPI003B63C0D7